MIGPDIQRARDFLENAQNSDGGWGYRTDSASVTEPTALALMSRPSQTALEQGVAWLLATQKDDGGWGMNAADDASNWLTAWAVWALLKISAEDSLTAARAGTAWLLDVPVARTHDPITSGLIGVDPALSGWAWQPDGGTWVEPTALSLLALSASAPADHPRLSQGVAFLRDRVCLGGGWNVGAPINFGQQMPPTPYQTVVTLLALRAAGIAREDPLIANSLNVLRQMLTPHVSAGSLAWGIVALRAWQADDTPLRDRLSARQSTAGGWENSPYATAAALQALQQPQTSLSFGG